MRYRTMSLSTMKARVTQRLVDEVAAKKRAELSKEEYQQWRQDTAPPNPSSLVDEQTALNECAPEGYRMVSRERVQVLGGYDVVYLFELLPVVML